MNLDPLAEKSFNLTPYRYAANNPIIFTDSNGLWELIFDETQGTLSINRQEGDNYESFLTATGLNQRQLKKLFGLSKKEVMAKLNNSSIKSIAVSSLSEDSKYGRLLQGAELALTEGNKELKANASEDEEDAMNNCLRCSINLSTDGRVDSKPLIQPSSEVIYGMDSMLIYGNFDRELGNEYTNVSDLRLRVGDVRRHSSDGGKNVSHATVFLLRDKDGVEYVLSKNGYRNIDLYQLMKSSEVVKAYGEVIGKKGYDKEITKSDGSKETVKKSDKHGNYRKQ